MLILRLAFRNIFRHSFRSLITLSSIIVGCCVYIFVSGYFEDTYAAMRESYTECHTGMLQVARKGYFEKNQEDPFKYMIDDPADLLTLIRSWPEIKRATPRIKVSALISTRSNSTPCGLEAMEPVQEMKAVKSRWAEKIEIYRDLIITDAIINKGGRPLSNDSPYGILIGQGLAQATGIGVGDAVTVLGVTKSGGLNALDLNVQGTFGTGSKVYDDFFMRMPIQTAHELIDSASIHYLFILLHKIDETPIIKARLLQYIALNNLDLEVRDWRELNSFYTRTEDLFNRIFFVLKLIISLIPIIILSKYSCSILFSIGSSTS